MALSMLDGASVEGALALVCPTCAAAPGASCVGPTQAPRGPHADRLALVGFDQGAPSA